MTVTAKRGPIYDPEIQNHTFSPEDLEKARKDYAQLEKEAPGFQAVLDQGVKAEGLEVINLIMAKQALSLYQEMQRELMPLQCMQDLLVNGTSQSLKPDDKQLVSLRFMKALFKMGRSTPLLPNDLPAIQGIMAEFSKISIHLIYPDDHFSELDDWMKEIVECQRLFRHFLPAVELEEGDSKGFLWTIMKDNQPRGYLFGTMHALKTKEAIAATRLCHEIYMKLTRCAILCTELKLTGKTAMGESVENKLLEFARSYGIVNFGLDDEGREDNVDMEFLMGWSIVQEMEFTDEDVKRNPQLKIIKEANDKAREFQNRAGVTYREGNREAFRASYQLPQPDEVEKKRQDALIRKTDACLQSLEKAAIPGEPIPLGFFAYGSAHMLDAGYPKTLVQGLRDLGYEVQPAG